MRLLLVEDEQFTRDGILSIIPWEELGIDQIETAQDGEEGYEKAVSFCPEIILTDVKMPRMDGVSMSFRIRDALPFCCIIFMSGYADKEYLKSAIQLSALNYIEKPFSPEELHSTLKIAVQKCKKHQEQLSCASEMARQLDLSLPMIKNRMLCYCCNPDSSRRLWKNICILYGRILMQVVFGLPFLSSFFNRKLLLLCLPPYRIPSAIFWKAELLFPALQM